MNDLNDPLLEPKANVNANEAALDSIAPVKGDRRSASTIAPSSKLAPWSLFLAGIALLSSIAIGWWSVERTKKIEKTIGQRIVAIETDNREVRNQSKQSQEQLREMQGRQSVSESKINESAATQSQLEKQYQELSRSRGDGQLQDVENSIAAAIAQLQWSGSIRGALLALQDADNRLERMNQPPLIGVRRQIAKDMERLRLIQVADPINLTAKLDLVIESVPNLALLSDAGNNAPPPEKSAGNPNQPFLEKMSQASVNGWTSLKTEFLHLFRVQRVDSADAILLAPEQAYFVRENLKLRLQTARLGVLARQEKMVRADIAAASEILKRFFDQKQRTVINGLAELEQVGAAPIAVELPTLAEVLAQVRALRSKEGKL
jgi:uroporphyrin-III C-methyltransferase